MFDEHNVPPKVHLAVNRLDEIIPDEDKDTIDPKILAGFAMAMAQGNFIAIHRTKFGYSVEVSKEIRDDVFS